MKRFGIGLLAAGALALGAYGGVRAAGEWAPVAGFGSATRLESGTVGSLVVAKPSGRAAFRVTFPAPFKTPPRVILTVVGDGDTPVSARLTAPESATGFSGVASTPFFLHQTASSVMVNWMAIGE